MNELATMKAKTGFKQTEVGLIPEDWETVKVDNISSRIGDGIHSTPLYSDSDEYYFINGNNLKFGKIEISEDTKTVDELEFKNHYRELNERSILLSINGTIGNIAFYNGEKIVLGKSAAYINLKNNTSKEYFYFILQTQGVQQFFYNNLTGSTIKNLGLTTIRNTPIPLPPLHEQKAIATALSDVDALIQSLDALIAKKKAIKQGAMQELLTPPLKGGKRLPGFSGEWVEKKLGEIAQMSSGGTPSSKKTEYYDGDINWVSITDMTNAGKYIITSKNKITEKGLQNSSARLFAINTVLLAMYASIGKCTIAKSEVTTSQAILGINVQKQLDFEFLYYFLNYKKTDLINLGQQGTQANLNKGMIQDIKLYLPNIEEQKAIAQILSDMDLEIESLERKKKKYEKIKQGMMQELLMGKTRLI